ncbi:hypothetical protein C8C85_0181 [Flavobacterium sp. 103]|uniref:hypothetical protein n=1 Tax=Flavobacterium sp. 103 TaxID=2135624 RepID=UPI000D5F58A2|nr:hypothetical protein [Flavobacterium sp. 103]PVX44447.1 hypothetical protein C8C85_0181 [Flavobacterium sp. 103]
MELIGIIKEYSPEYKGKEYVKFKTKCNYDNKENILNYLQNGIPIAVTMQVVQSLIKDDLSIIGGITYLTDGYWIWPNYLNYYFDKESIELPSKFIDFISKNKTSKILSDEEKLEAINFIKNSL